MVWFDCFKMNLSEQTFCRAHLFMLIKIKLLLNRYRIVYNILSYAIYSLLFLLFKQKRRQVLQFLYIRTLIDKSQ